MFKNIDLRNCKIEFFIALSIILLFHLPLIIMGQNGYIMIDDVLNLEFLYKHLLKVNDLIFELNPYLVIPNIYPDGLSLGYIHSRFNIIDLIFFFFNSFDAYVINSILVRIIAFFSMYSLIKMFYPSIGKTNNFLVSVVFSLTPINSIYGLTSIGLPLIFIAFNNLLNNKKIGLSFFLIILYVIYSTPLTYPFIAFYLIIIFVYNFIYENETKRLLLFFYGILFFFFSIIITDYSLISFSSSDSHRVLRAVFETPVPSLLGIIYGIVKYTLFGSYHPSLFIPASILILILLNFKKINRKVLIIISLILIHRLIDLIRPFIENTLGDYFQIIKVFDIGRFTWLNPFLFYLALIVIIKILIERNRSRTFIVLLLIVQLFINIIRNPEFTFNLMDNKIAGNYFFNDDILVKDLKSFRSNPADINGLSSLNYKEFFSEDLFEEIKISIGLPQNEYKIITYGIDPSVLIFNGFYTLDGSTSNHSKDYHLTFNTIQPANNIYASHNLLLVNDFCRHCSLDKGSFSISKLKVDYETIKKLKGKYLISGIKILNDDNLNFLKSFENSFYRIYLYNIK